MIKLIEEFDFNKFIDDYWQLIDNARWDELYQEVWKYKKKDAATITSLLIEEGANIPIPVCKVLFGIKKHDTTLSLRASKDGGKTFSIGFTKNQGMKGGHMVAWRSIPDAEKYCGPGEYVYTLNPSTVEAYDWVPVTLTDGGFCYTTTLAKNSFKNMVRVTHAWSSLESQIRKNKKEIEEIDSEIECKAVTRREHNIISDKLGFSFYRRLDITQFVNKSYPDLVNGLKNYWGMFTTSIWPDGSRYYAALYENCWNELINKLGYTKANFDTESPYSSDYIIESVRKYIEDTLNSNVYPEINRAKVYVSERKDLFEVSYAVETVPSLDELYQKELDKLVSSEEQEDRINTRLQRKSQLEAEIQDLKQQVKDLKKQGTP